MSKRNRKRYSVHIPTQSGHHSEGNSAGVTSRFRPLFLGGSELIRTVPD